MMPFRRGSSLQDVVFRAKRRLLGASSVRRTRLYGLGVGKTGTHSLAEMFSTDVRARHEPEAGNTIDKIIDRHYGRISDDEWIGWLRARDRRMALEVDSASLNLHLLAFLVPEFPDARFVLTIRDCYSWLNSAINHIVRVRERLPPHWLKWRAFQAGAAGYIYGPADEVLKTAGLPNLDNQLFQWRRYNEEAIAKVPAERLLVVRTDQITQRAFEIADFAGLPRRTVRLEGTHAFRNLVTRQPIREIDRIFLEAKVEEHCRPLMARFFPEIGSLEDAKL